MKAWENTTVTAEDIAATFTNGFGADRVTIDEQDEHAVIYTVYGTSSAKSYVASKHNDFETSCGNMNLERVYNVFWSKRIFE